MHHRAREAVLKAVEAMYVHVSKDEVVWSMGEQAVGIFCDVGSLVRAEDLCVCVRV